MVIPIFCLSLFHQIKTIMITKTFQIGTITAKINDNCYFETIGFTTDSHEPVIAYRKNEGQSLLNDVTAYLDDSNLYLTPVREFLSEDEYERVATAAYNKVRQEAKEYIKDHVRKYSDCYFCFLPKK